MSATTERDLLELKLLEEQIRHERAQADIAEMDRAMKADAERDREVKTGRIRHLYVNDVIVGKSADAWLDALQHWERRDPGSPVTIDINSPGGSVTDGLAIYDQIMRMRRKGHHVTTRGTGIVASMAGVLLQAGDERIIDKNATMLVHEGSQTLQGTFTAGEQEDMKALGDMLRKRLLGILADRSKLTERQIANRWKRRDWFLDADEALKLGFVDRVE